MCRSSKILCFLSACLATAFLASGPADARGLAIHGGVSFGTGPFVGAPRAAVRPGVFPAVRSGIRPGIVGAYGRNGRPFGRFGRFGGGFGYGGFDELGLGLSTAGDMVAPPLPVDEYGPAPQRSYLPPTRPRCIKPLIISIGHGLRHAVRTRVVYGSPPPCGS